MRICGTIIEGTELNIVQEARNFLNKEIDLLEVRADLLYKEMTVDLTDDKGGKEEKFIKTIGDIAREIKGLRKNAEIIFTMRSEKEGGYFSLQKGSIHLKTEEDRYKDILGGIAKLGVFDYVDVEVQMLQDDMDFINQLKQEGIKTIASAHVADGGFDREQARFFLEALLETKADIVKLALLTEDEKQVDEFHQLLEEYNLDRPHIIIAMGEAGRRTRYEQDWAGSCITFGCGNKPAAPGQISVDELKKLCYTLPH